MKALVARSDFPRGVLVGVIVEVVAAAHRRKSVGVAPDVAVHAVSEEGLKAFAAVVVRFGTGGREDLGAWELLGANRTGDELTVVGVGIRDQCPSGVDCGGCDDWRCRYWCRNLGTWRSVDWRWAGFDGIGSGGWYVGVLLAVLFACIAKQLTSDPFMSPKFGFIPLLATSSRCSTRILSASSSCSLLSCSYLPRRASSTCLSC